MFVSIQTGIVFACVYMSESVCLQSDEDDLGIRDTAVNKTDKIPRPYGAYIVLQEATRLHQTSERAGK